MTDSTPRTEVSHSAATSKLLMTILERIVEREHDPILLERSVHVARHLIEALNSGWVPLTQEDVTHASR